MGVVQPPGEAGGTGINSELDRYWAAATPAAVRQDDPLAFGTDRPRAAPATYVADLARLECGVPSDRSTAVKQAEGELADAGQHLRQVDAELKACWRQSEAAAECRWGRRDEAAVAVASAAVERAEREVAAAVHAERDARSRLDAEVSHQRQRAQRWPRRNPGERRPPRRSQSSTPPSTTPGRPGWRRCANKPSPPLTS